MMFILSIHFRKNLKDSVPVLAIQGIVNVIDYVVLVLKTWLLDRCWNQTSMLVILNKCVYVYFL